MVRRRRIIWATITIVVIGIGVGPAWPLISRSGYLKEAWSREASLGWIFSETPLLLPDGMVLLLTPHQDGLVYEDWIVLLEPDGTEVFSIRPEGVTSLDYVVRDDAGNLYINTNCHNWLLAVSPDGRELWKYTIPEHYVRLGDSMVDDGFYLLVTAYNPNQSRTVQHVDFQGRLLDEFTVDFQATDITTGPGGIYLVDRVFSEGEMVVYGYDGEVQWTHTPPVVRTGNEMIDIDFIDDLVVLTIDGYGIQAFSRCGEMQWEFTDPQALRRRVTSQIVGDRIFLANGRGMVYELDRDGRTVWSKDTGCSVQEMFIGGDTIYVHAFYRDNLPDWFHQVVSKATGSKSVFPGTHSLLLGIPMDGGRHQTWEVREDNCWPRAAGPDGAVYAVWSTGASVAHRIHLVHYDPPH